jgi:hypothetical protein
MYMYKTFLGSGFTNSEFFEFIFYLGLPNMIFNFFPATPVSFR